MQVLDEAWHEPSLRDRSWEDLPSITNPGRLEPEHYCHGNIWIVLLHSSLLVCSEQWKHLLRTASVAGSQMWLGLSDYGAVQIAVDTSPISQHLFPQHTGPRFGRIHVNLHTNTWKTRVLIIQNTFLTGWAPPGMKQWRHTNVLQGLWAAGRSKLRLMPYSAGSTDCVLLCFSGSKDSNIRPECFGDN